VRLVAAVRRAVVAAADLERATGRPAIIALSNSSSSSALFECSDRIR
jgi:hypothetical protein